MNNRPILCAGSVLWDTIGHAARDMKIGDDIGGRIRQVPGGVALNIAMALAKHGLGVELLSYIGRDDAGAALIAACHARGLGTAYVRRGSDWPTDHYMAIETPKGVMAAIADAHSLEKAGMTIFAPLYDGTLGEATKPLDAVLVVDGNLTEGVLAQLTQGPAFGNCDLRIAPASPGKAARLAPLLSHPKATFYVNRTEAEILLGDRKLNASQAAKALVDCGCARALVTDGPNEAALADQQGLVTAKPFEVKIKRLTGAGDVFMSAHIAADLRGADPKTALSAAIDRAAEFISSEEPL